MSKRTAEIEEDELRRRKLEEALEVKSLRRIISAYLNYPDAAEDDVRRYERSFRELPPAHKSLLSHLPSKYKSLRRCMSMNTYFILNMLQAFEPPQDMSLGVDCCEDQHLECCPDEHHSHQDGSFSASHYRPAEEAMWTTTNQMVCDVEDKGMITGGTTSSEEKQLPGLKCEPDSNEGGSSAIKASSDQESQYRHVSSNGSVASCDWLDPSLRLNVPLVDVDKGQVERDECYQPILEELNRLFPMRNQESAGITEGFSMCGGDFVEVYSDPSQEGVWDAVVTCFFIDTAHNIVEYIEIIWKILKDGGVWINLGPLLYHFADMHGENEMSIELSLEDIKKVAFHYGFVLEKESTIKTTYTANLRSMMQNRYFAAFWTMTKNTGKRTTEKHDAE